MRRIIVAASVLVISGGIFAEAQGTLGQQLSNSLVSVPPRAAVASQQVARAKQETTGYVLGPGDQISVHVVDFEEITDKPIGIDLSGCIHLPMVGRIPVSGLTVEQVAAEVATLLRVYILRPDVSVSITDFRSQPVSVIGAVKNPGVQQVQGQRTLLEMLSLAGGLDNTTAGSTLKITRRLEWGPIPLPGAVTDSTKHFSVAQVNVKSLLEARNPEENILIKPYDVISVPRGETVYVIGEVLKAGGFILNDTEHVTVLQALSMAGGADKMAQPQHARILRMVPGGSSRTEIAVDINKILSGKQPDIPMQPEDILYVPNSVPKRAAVRALEAAIQAGTGMAIFR